MRCRGPGVGQLAGRRAMIACASCGYEAPDDFAFCPKCGGALALPLPAAEERKVVTTLFCDLVCFTAISEAADPETSTACSPATTSWHASGSSPTAASSRSSSVTPWSASSASPRSTTTMPRAVRAGVRVRVPHWADAARRVAVDARCGVHIGVASVSLDVDPASGQGFLTGDAVNTAARLQTAASPGGVVVGTLTRELTARASAARSFHPAHSRARPSRSPHGGPAVPDPHRHAHHRTCRCARARPRREIRALDEASPGLLLSHRHAPPARRRARHR